MLGTFYLHATIKNSFYNKRHLNVYNGLVFSCVSPQSPCNPSVSTISLSFYRINLFSKANLYFDFTFVVSLCHVLVFFVVVEPNNCQIGCPAFLPGPLKRTPFSKNLLSLVFSVGTINKRSWLFLGP